MPGVISGLMLLAWTSFTRGMYLLNRSYTAYTPFSAHNLNTSSSFWQSLWKSFNRCSLKALSKQQYISQRRYDIPEHVNINSDFELVFLLADGRVWFRKSEVRPLNIETELQVFGHIFKRLSKHEIKFSLVSSFLSASIRRVF